MLGTIAAGIGPKDVETLFSFMGIPMPSSFPYVTFPRIENAIGETIVSVSQQSMRDAIKEEVEIETGKKFSEFMKSKIEFGLIGSHDMGWSKRSSGHRYDSLSGHAFLVSFHWKKVIAAKITSKKCNTC